jgi:hypothetical protein
MANDEHIAMLKKGVDAWNEWRRTKRAHVIFRGADLRAHEVHPAEVRPAEVRGVAAWNAWRHGASS